MEFNYRYPLTKLEKSDDYLKITVIKYVAPGFARPEQTNVDFSLPTAGDPRDKKEELGTIILPIPDNVRTSNTTQWTASSFNPLQAGASKLLQGAITDPQEILNQIKSTGGQIGNAIKTSSVQKLIQAAVINAGMNILPGGGGNVTTEQLLSRTAGAIFNSNIELIFTSVNLREGFSFAFDIVPRSQKEAEMVRKIIVAFKKHSAAKKSSKEVAATGLFLSAPEVFKVEYMSGINPHPYLNKFKICALNGVGVDYTAGGTYATYDDGTPVNIRLELSFQEITPIYAEDYDTVGGTGY